MKKVFTYKKTLLLAVLLIATSIVDLSAGGGIFNVLCGRNKYTTIPSSPTFGTTTTLTYGATTTGNIFTATTAGNRDILLSGTWDRLVANGLVGTTGSRYRFRNLDGNTILGNALGTQQPQGCINSQNGSTFCEFYGLDPLNPLLLEGNNNGTQWTSVLSGTDLLMKNVVTKNIGFANILINSGTSANKYTTIDISFYRSFGLNNEGESIYMGNTSLTSYSMFDNVYLRNMLGTDKGRDGIQLSSMYNFVLENATFYNNGIEDVVQQRNLVQVQNSNGVIRNCIFHLAPELCNIFANGVTFENCYFRWTSGHGYIGDAAGAYSTFQTGNGQPILFNNCVFDPVNNVTSLFRVAEKVANIEVRNSIISSRITNLYDDVRTAGFTNSLIGTPTTNGNTQPSFSTIEQPIYTNFNPNDYLNHGLVLTPYYYNRSMGYRTPVAQ
jgi:hypothetical protein